MNMVEGGGERRRTLLTIARKKAKATATAGDRTALDAMHAQDKKRKCDANGDLPSTVARNKAKATAAAGDRTALDAIHAADKVRNDATRDANDVTKRERLRRIVDKRLRAGWLDDASIFDVDDEPVVDATVGAACAVTLAPPNIHKLTRDNYRKRVEHKSLYHTRWRVAGRLYTGDPAGPSTWRLKRRYTTPLSVLLKEKYRTRGQIPLLWLHPISGNKLPRR
jgi:hypothetical protein